MHDALRDYDDDDDQVADVDEDQFPFRLSVVEPIAIGRVSTENLNMHVSVDSNWHRVMPDQTATSCEKPWHAGRSPTRRGELLEHPLCPVCFTPAEIARADASFVRKQGLRWFRKQFEREPTFTIEWYRNHYGQDPA